MIRSEVWVRLIALSALSSVACGSSPSTCTPGMSIECTCRDGRRGAQECSAEGTFEMCMCEGGALDAGSPREDAGDRREDAGTPGGDAGTPGGDAGTPGSDAGTPGDDGGAPGDDGGAPGDDGGTPSDDAGGVIDGGPAVLDVVALEAGNETSCAAMRDGRVLCWGHGFAAAPSALHGPTMAVDVGAGYDHTCFVESTGDTACLGDNAENQLGNGSDAASSAIAVSVTGLIDAVSITAGRVHTCALRTGGTVSCWGDRNYGQTGASISTGWTSSNSRVPFNVPSLSGVTQVEAGRDHSCALLGSGQVACWGRGDSFALGNGSTDHSNTPVPVGGLSDAVHLSVSAGRGCAVRSTGQVACWGGGSALLQSPTGLDDAVEVAAGGNHTCARSAAGVVRCWGQNYAGQLGDGTLDDSLTEPVMVSGLNDAVLLAAGWRHTCAARSTGEIVCWGANAAGQLGDGTALTRRVPTTVTLP